MSEDASNGGKPLGRRTLAAVMFTDAVDFSRTVGEDEERGLRVTGRDLELISQLVRMFDGRVLKSTGDGVLAVFASGVQAVSCAQEIQKQLAEQAEGLPEGEVLRHRIGIHLGDIYVSGNEVMGDGVNVAARLQSEAPPGGIAITQALYEVAKTRLSFKTVHLGARRLKNIAEAVQVYQVLPGDAERRRARRVASVLHRPGVKLAGAAAGLLLIVLVAVLLALKMVDRRNESANGENASPDATKTTDRAVEALTAYPKIKTEHLKTRDYAGIAAWIEEHGLETPDSALHDDFVKYRKIAQTFDWMEEQLVGYTPEAPLVVNSPRVGKMRVYMKDGELKVQIEGVQEQTVDVRTEPQASFLLNVMRACALRQWGEERPERGSANAHLLDGMVLFAKENDLDTRGLLMGLRRRQGTPSEDDTDDPGDLFARFDLNKDRKLSRDEIPRMLRNRLMRADANNDGMLTLEELLAARKRPAGTRRRRP